MGNDKDQSVFVKSRNFASTKTSSRKFSSKENKRNSEAVDPANGSHIVDQAASLSSLSYAISRVAELTKNRIRSVRETLAGIDSENQTGERRPVSHVGDQEDRSVDFDDIESISSLIASDDVRSARYLSAVRGMIALGNEMIFVPVGGEGADINDSVPEINSIELDIDKKKGLIDCFYASIKFSLPRTDDIAAVRVFRAVVAGPPVGAGRLSVRGMEMLRSDKNRTKQKNHDHMSFLESSFREAGIDNAVTALVPVDPFLNSRVGAQSNAVSTEVIQTVSVNSVDTSSKSADLAPYLVPDSFVRLDRSVVNDLKSLRNIQIQNPSLSVSVVDNSVKVGSFMGTLKRLFTEHASQIQKKLSRIEDVVEANNRLDFREIAFVSPDRLQNVELGDTREFTIEDTSVMFGRMYRYYIISVDRDMNESVRSRIVEVPVDGIRIPERPRDVSARVFNQTVALTIHVDDQLIEKFEIYRKSDLPSIAELANHKIRSILSEIGFVTDNEDRKKLENSIIQIGESLNSIRTGGSIFIDRKTVPGRKYTYRVYSVDVFGNKSESPFELEVYVPDYEHKIVGLNRPTILAEVDSSTNKCRVTFGVDDPKVKMLLLTRRDLTLGQRAFTTPDGVNILKIGSANVAEGHRKFEDVRLQDRTRDIAWNGVFANDGKDHVFIDRTVSMDHTYQYMVVGVDRFGNKTSPILSRPIFIMRRPFINEPLNLFASVLTGSTGLSGITLRWIDGNIDVTAEDRVGNREELANSEVRTLYQVERRKKGEDRWHEFPLLEEREMFDPLGSVSGSAPNFRPPYLDLNERYVYRVQTFQTGNFVSNFSEPVEIFVGANILPPLNFQIKTTDTKSRPFYAMLNWNTDKLSGVVDRWEIERSEVNNIAAERLNSRSSRELEGLNFLKFRTIFRESSRFRSFSQDNLLRVRDNKTVVGDHHFMDASVRFGNTYFYRIRAVDVAGRFSSWVYKAIKISDFYQQGSTRVALTREDKVELASSLQPLDARKNSTQSSTSSGRITSYGLISPFNLPVHKILTTPNARADLFFRRKFR